MKIILFKIASFFFLSVMLFTLSFAKQITPLPKYNNIKLGKSCDEYKVYSDVILQLIKLPHRKDILVIRQKTTLPMDTKFDERHNIYLKKNFGKLISDDLIQEFATVNSKRVILQDMFSNSLNVILLSKEKESQIFNPADGGWKRFYSKYPKSFGIIELSRVAFNTDKTKALLYYGSVGASGKGGIGWYVLLKKQENEWVIQKKVICWIA